MCVCERDREGEREISHTWQLLPRFFEKRRREKH
jgi:hypothetical protein